VCERLHGRCHATSSARQADRASCCRKR
jgi:hypothetical protein